MSPSTSPYHGDPGEVRPLTASVHRYLSGGPRVPDVAESSGEADELVSLLAIHDLWTAPIERLGERVARHGDPAVVALKRDLEEAFIGRLDTRCADVGPPEETPVAAVRRIAAASAVPEAYRWLERDATWEELVRFLALEGGPDGGFDDLVALAQVGVTGDPKVCLAANYWDEMGRGRLDDVHTELHARLVRAVDLYEIPRAQLPVAALERLALGGVLVTNRKYQPEALGALGLLELQAGPRCRAVLRALDRLDAPADAYPFYEEHAVADPRHGKEWLDRVIRPLAEAPVWATGMVRGARWRAEVNRRFFEHVVEAFGATAAEASDCTPRRAA